MGNAPTSGSPEQKYELAVVAVAVGQSFLSSVVRSGRSREEASPVDSNHHKAKRGVLPLERIIVFANDDANTQPQAKKTNAESWLQSRVTMHPFSLM